MFTREALARATSTLAAYPNDELARQVLADAGNFYETEIASEEFRL